MCAWEIDAASVKTDILITRSVINTAKKSLVKVIRFILKCNVYVDKGR